MRIDGEAPGVREENRVAVRRRFGRKLGPDNSGSARSVLHDNLLFESVGQTRRELSGHHVRAASRWLRNDEADGTHRVFSRATFRQQDKADDTGEKSEKFHIASLPLP